MLEPDAWRGAYGLILARDVDSDLLTSAAPDWLPWRLRAHPLPVDSVPTDDDYHASGTFARLPLLGGGWVEIDREQARSDLYLDHQPGRHEWAHPAPATTAATVAWWHGRQALHGTAVSVDGRAVALLGAREQGKSTTSMRMLARGFELVADDLLVVDGRTLFAGPRSLDLREASARRLGVGTPIGVVGSRERWRVVAPDCAPVHELAGFVELAWGDTLEVTSLDLPERFAALVRHRTMPMFPPLDPAALLATLGLPFLRLTRPHDLDGLDRAVDAVLDALGLRALPAPSAPPVAATPASAGGSPPGPRPRAGHVRRRTDSPQSAAADG